MKKIVLGTALLAVVLACVSCGSSPESREESIQNSGGTFSEADRKAAEKAWEGKYYARQFEIFRNPEFMNQRSRNTGPAPTKGNPFSGGGLGFTVITRGGSGGGTSNRSPERSEPAYPLASSADAVRQVERPYWIREEAPSERDIDRAIAAYGEAIKLAPSGTWQIPDTVSVISNQEARAFEVREGLERPEGSVYESMLPTQGGIQALLENARESNRQWVAVEKPKRDAEAARAAAIVNPNPNPNSEYDFDIVQNEEGGITITKYLGERLHVVIPQTISGIRVTRIGDNAFASGGQKRRSLRSVVIPDSVTRIPEGAFSGNGDLTSIVIPNSVTEIGDSAFGACGLTSVTLSNRLVSIRDGAFQGNELTSIQFPSTLTSIGHRAFSGNKITNLVLPERIHVIREYAFRGNPVKTLVIPQIMATEDFGESYELFLFESATSDLTSVTLPANMEYVYSVPDSLYDFYKSQGKRAGTYVFNGRIWTRQ